MVVVVEAALLQIGRAAWPSGAVQHLLEKRGRRHRPRLCSVASRTARSRSSRDSCGTSSPARRASCSTASGKRKILGLHGEADDVAMRAAAEAMIEALVLDDIEGRRLLVMEGHSP